MDKWDFVLIGLGFSALAVIIWYLYLSPEPSREGESGSGHKIEPLD
jgi:hypothetical protein